jgi:processive rubber oxygenase RoxA-like protein
VFRVRAIHLIALGLVAATGAFAVSFWHHDARRAIARDTLAASFAADLRHVVYEWDADDPRPEDERQQALFSFVYETYDASAWIPQSLFDRNVFTQVVAGDVDTIVSQKVGLVSWRDNKFVPAFGMAPNADPSQSTQPLRWTVNCLVCHTAEIDGVAYLGAGTKTFDELWLGEALKRMTGAGWRLSTGSGDAALSAEAHRILTAHHHDKIDSLTRARSTAFAASHVELYMRPHHGEMPRVEDVGRGDVKTPPLWHTVAKMPARRWYVDGSFHGPFPLMASSMELEKDRPFDALVQVVVPRIKSEFESVVRHLRPPRYPYEIDRVLAARGRELFYSREIGCSRCHGDYDGKGNVRWPGVFADVGTDRSRLDVVSGRFTAAFNDSPLAAEGALVKSEGYAATPLTGVWANFPYLHNGSVPTLHDLLGPVSERPGMFEVMAARRLDRAHVGQPISVDPDDARLGETELRRRFGTDRNWFNVERPGCGNGGHDVWPRIRTDANRRALIEYLKTL